MFGNFGRKPDAEKPPLNNAEIIASFRSRREEKATQLQRIAAEELAALPPGERERAAEKLALQDKISAMARSSMARSRRPGHHRSEPYIPDRKDPIRIPAGLQLAAYPAAACLIWLVNVGLTTATYDKDDATEFLQQEGYTDVQHEGSSIVFVGLGGCGTGDSVKYEFDATAPNGTDHVQRIVCNGLLKDATIRQGN